jgi:FkbM family methyltransferase
MAAALPEPWRSRLGFAWSYASELGEPLWVVLGREFSASGRRHNRMELAAKVASRLSGLGLILDPRTDPGAIREVVLAREYEHPGFIPDATTTVLDIGAQHGEFSVLCSRIYGAKVIAFEPLDTNCAIIEHNLHLNGDAPVTLYPLAVGDHDGEITGYRYDTMLVRDAGPMTGRPVQLKQVRLDGLDLDTFLEGRRVIMKVDVEGFEQEVLAGAAVFLARHRPLLIIETDERRSEGVTRILTASGYRLVHTTTKPTGRLLFAEPLPSPSSPPVGQDRAGPS